jgi:hypothetical protein
VPEMNKRFRSGPTRPEIGSLLPPAEAPVGPNLSGSAGPAADEQQDLLERLPTLLTPRELAAVLGVSPETIRRRIRQGKQTTTQVLGINRIPAESAADQVRADVLKRLPKRYRAKRNRSAEPQEELQLAGKGDDALNQNSNPN